MDIEASEQTAFLPEQVEGILMAAIDSVLKNEVYGESIVCTSDCAVLHFALLDT
jgi:hypothetical protein